MFDIGWQELLVLGAVAMVIFPPSEYPELLRGVVGLMHRLRRMGEDVREGIDDFSQKHLSEEFESIEGARRSIGTSFGETQKLLRQSVENKDNLIADLESRVGKGKVDSKSKSEKAGKKVTKKVAKKVDKSSVKKVVKKIETGKTQAQNKLSQPASKPSRKPSSPSSNPSSSRSSKPRVAS